MASWIVHLRLAERLLDYIKGLDGEYFAIGNIAPDSGIPDRDWEHFDPPAEILHFQSAEDNAWQIADLEFYRRYLMPIQRELLDAQRFSFMLGYFFHLVTDNLWSEQVGKPTMERFAEQFKADPKFIWEVKRDWYGLDFEHVRQNPDSIFWTVFLNCQFNQDFLDFLPKQALQIRIDYIKQFYQRTDDKLEAWYGRRPDIYLHRQDMDDFIAVSSAKLYGIYKYLLLHGEEIPNVSSVLSLEIDNGNK